MNVEPFAIGRSVLHRLDPRCRILGAALFSGVTAVLEHPWALVLALAAALVLVAAARLPLKPLGQRLGAAAAFLLMLWIVLPLSHGGPLLVQVGPLTLYPQGLALAGRISLKTGAILLAFTALVATMPAAALGHALDRLGLTPKLTFLLLMCYRYLFVIEQEYQRLARAARIRGFRPGTNRHTYRTYAYLVGMLFVRASGRAERVHQAMRCRGFDGRFHSIQAFDAPGRPEAVFGLLLGSTAAAMIFIEASPFF
jgi:cobalt/nickel transport system permease protein